MLARVSLVLEVDREVVGCACGYARYWERYWGLVRSVRVGYISTLGICPQQQRKGLGRKLLRHLLQLAHGQRCRRRRRCRLLARGPPAPLLR